MRYLDIGLAAAGVVLVGGQAFGQCVAPSSPTQHYDSCGNPAVAISSNGGTVTATTTPSAVTWQGNIASVTTSVALSTATPSPGSPALPTTSPIGLVTVINRSTGAALYLCWLGGTCTTGGEYLAPSASDSKYIASATWPTVYAPSATSVDVHN